MQSYPDYGLHLEKQGITRTQDLVFFDVRVTTIYMMSREQCSFTVNTGGVDGEFAVTFDFSFPVYQAIFGYAPADTQQQAIADTERFRKSFQPFPWKIVPKQRFTIDVVHARLGSIQECPGEKFIPLIIESVTK
jgi:hypothetical protein